MATTSGGQIDIFPAVVVLIDALLKKIDISWGSRGKHRMTMAADH
jgi:hypothetical protein